MATATAVQTASPWTPPFPVYRFTVEQYHRMIKAGILTENDRVELLEGWVVPRMPHNPHHDGTVWLVQTVLLSRLPPDWIVRVQSAVTTRDSEPEPDVVIARGPGQRYYTAHPEPKDIAVVIEVSDTTLADDRIKGRLYARARIPVYWIVNLVDSVIEVYTDAKSGRSPAYRQRRDYKIPNSIPLVLGGKIHGNIPVREFIL